jgi:hypothetical protein
LHAHPSQHYHTRKPTHTKTDYNEIALKNDEIERLKAVIEGLGGGGPATAYGGGGGGGGGRPW